MSNPAFKPKQYPNPKPVQEAGCLYVTAERKYYHVGDKFIKRTLRPREFITGYRGLYIPPLGKERLMNDAASIRYIREKTNIPVPTLCCEFEDDDAYYVITEFIEGKSMKELTEAQKQTVSEEIKVHLETLQTLTSNSVGGPSGLVIPPYRVTMESDNNNWVLPDSQTHEYVFCHNDLAQHNVIVDPTTLKIKAIIDWEYSGFWPKFFESPFYTRPGPSAALKGEVNDTRQLLDFLEATQPKCDLSVRQESKPVDPIPENVPDKHVKGTA
ncbi:hypothetical protein MMC07_000864 [Pseudocyphellaria aurata]|nr:hypothetical protein [Pseudocyphellaria aurata]